MLRDAVGQVSGGRQHWLRFSGDELFLAYEGASLRYDATVGWSERPGFRAGLAAPFRPYVRREERPADLIEFPLAIMDVTLEQRRRAGVDWQGEQRRVLDETRSHGVGGVSVVWHDTVFEGAQLSSAVADSYWELIDDFALVSPEELLPEMERRHPLNRNTAWNR